jgi:signal transduction histidine kinase/phage shock protein PspC (stress-responsive transcriptional regulator)
VTSPTIGAGAAPLSTPAPPPSPDAPRLHRRVDGRLVGGVCGGVADHLGLDPLRVRVAFALLSGIFGFGLALYAALWVFVPSEAPLAGAAAGPAGLAAASRDGRRPSRTRSARRGDTGQLVALSALGAGILLLLANTSLGVPLELAGPVLLAAAGVALIWTLGDDAERRRLQSLPSRAPLVERLSAPGSRGRAVRVVAGVLLVAAGVVTFLAGRGDLASAGPGLLAVAVVALGVVVVAGPFLWRLLRERDAERRERIVSQERADVAAHLHDSVLQTLALIQKQADDPRSVVRLARAQERDLRGWLYGGPGEPAVSLAAALREVAAQVEEAHGVPVELVSVGDAALDDDLAALVAATREAVVNAAKHSGASVVDVYAESTADEVDVFVRDRGKGFDPDTVPADRLGLRGSVVGRVERHGGRARIRTAPGEGTEVRLTLRRETP